MNPLRQGGGETPPKHAFNKPSASPWYLTTERNKDHARLKFVRERVVGLLHLHGSHLGFVLEVILPGKFTTGPLKKTVAKDLNVRATRWTYTPETTRKVCTQKYFVSKTTMITHTSD